MLKLIFSLILIAAPCVFGEKSLKKNQSSVVVSISGSVNNSAVIRAEKNFSLKSAFQICGGLNDKASKNYIQLFRIKASGKVEVLRLQIPRDLSFVLRNGDMVVVRHKAYWSTRKEENDRVKKILAEEAVRK